MCNDMTEFLKKHDNLKSFSYFGTVKQNVRKVKEHKIREYYYPNGVVLILFDNREGDK